jgi:uncharacterized membrane protein
MRPRRVEVVALACLAAALVCVLAPGVPGPVRVAAGVALILVLPGASVARLLLPAGTDKAVVVVTSLALSIAVMVLAALLLDAASVRLTERSWSSTVAAIAGFTIVLSSERVARRRSTGLGVRAPRVRDVALLAAAALLVAGTVLLARRPLTPPSAATGYTELWVSPTDTGVQVGVRSHEFAPTRYRLDVSDGATPLVPPTSFTLSTGSTWTTDVAARTGSVRASLYRDDEASPYREVRITLPAAPGASR